MPESKQPKTFPYMVVRDQWDADGNRITKGTQVDLTAEQAMDGVESGALARVKG